MTIEELYGKVLADDELKASLTEAVKENKVADWATAQGLEATEEELLAYVKAAAMESGELSDEELESLAGGGYTDVMSSIYNSIISVGLYSGGCFE